MEMDRNGDGPAAEIVVCSEGCREELLRCLELGQGAADDEWSFQVTLNNAIFSQISTAGTLALCSLDCFHRVKQHRLQ